VLTIWGIVIFWQKDFAKAAHKMLVTLTPNCLYQGKLKGEVSLYHWPPVWLIWNRLYDNWPYLFLFAKQTNPNQSKRRSMVQWYFPFSIPCLYHSLQVWTVKRFRRPTISTTTAKTTNSSKTKTSSGTWWPSSKRRTWRGAKSIDVIKLVYSSLS